MSTLTITQTIELVDAPTTKYQPSLPILPHSSSLNVVESIQIENAELRLDGFSKRRSAAIIATVAGVTFLNTMGSGILTVALPSIAKELGISRELLLWPASIYALTCGCSLLIAGSMADIIDRRITFLVGCGFYAAFTLACGFSKDTTSIIVFRGVQGVSISLCLTTAVGIIANSFPIGHGRNIAFACVGAGSPVGYTVGLVLGGVFAGTIGWRWAFWLAAIVNVIIFGAAIWGLPSDGVTRDGDVLKRLRSEIDWVVAGIATIAISLLSYVLAIITGSSASIKMPTNIVILTVALLLFPGFALWMHRQERLQRPAIIPNSIWNQSAFTSTCLAVFFTWGAFNPFGYFSTLFFQEIKNLTPLQTSLRFLPTVVCGVLANIVTGFLVRKTSASHLVAGSSVFSAIACLLMALVKPEWTFWAMAFPAIFLSPMSSDVLYTVSNLVISDAFPASKQSLAGGVFNTVSQIGNSVGLTLGAVIAATVSARVEDPTSVPGLMTGYRATFWYCFVALSSVVVISLFGLKKAGKVGTKDD